MTQDAMRDKIEAAIWSAADEGMFDYGSNAGVIITDMAQSVIDAMPDMVVPLVWYCTATGQASQSQSHYYEIYENSDGGFTFDCGASVIGCADIPEAYERANAHHRAAIMAAFGVTL